MMPDFSHRFQGRELMDDLRSSGADLHQALQELDAINYLLGGNYVTMNGLAQLLNSDNSGDVMHIADLGCGSGDMLRQVRRLLVRRGDEARLTGIDANPNVITYAGSRTPSSCDIRYENVDIFSDDFRSRKFDIVIATLFFHHFSNEALTSFFNQLKSQVSTGLVINDIHRHWLAYYSIKWLTRIFSRSAMVKHDAPVSVMRAFRKKELVDILTRAGIFSYKIKWRWAFRWQVVVRF